MIGISSKFSTDGGEEMSHSKPIARQGLGGAFSPSNQETKIIENRTLEVLK